MIGDLLDELKDHAFMLLKRSCNDENIIARLLGEKAGVYAELREAYVEYFPANWEKVMEMQVD